MSAYAEAIREHYERVWAASLTPVPFSSGPVDQISPDFKVLCTPPRPDRAVWTYCTQGMSKPDDDRPLELHMFSSLQADDVAELFAATAHYHRTGAALGLHHTVNFGRPWFPGSSLEFGFLSLPYLDGPALEWMTYGQTRAQFLWLIPIHRTERSFKQLQGVEALEQRMEATDFAYADPFRPLLV